MKSFFPPISPFHFPTFLSLSLHFSLILFSCLSLSPLNLPTSPPYHSHFLTFLHITGRTAAANHHQAVASVYSKHGRCNMTLAKLAPPHPRTRVFRRNPSLRSGTTHDPQLYSTAFVVIPILLFSLCVSLSIQPVKKEKGGELEMSACRSEKHRSIWVRCGL